MFWSFGNSSSTCASDPGIIRMAEKEILSLEKDLNDRNWAEIWSTLAYEGIPLASFKDKISTDSKNKYKEIILKIDAAYRLEKEVVDKDFRGDIEKTLEKLIKIL